MLLLIWEFFLFLLFSHINTVFTKHISWLLKSLLKGVCQKIFDLHFFHDLNPFGFLINRPKYFQISFRFRWDIRSQSLKNSTPRCAWHRGVKIFCLANKKNFFQFFSLMIYMFIPKRISPYCPFKSIQRLTRISICNLHQSA